MENSYKFFANRDCRYYPCHKIEELNCLFCYCPLYSFPDCPGNYTMVAAKGKNIKSCMDCTFPHEAGNYEKIIALLIRGPVGDDPSGAEKRQTDGAGADMGTDHSADG